MQDPEVLNAWWMVQVQVATSLYEKAAKAVDEGDVENFRRLRSEYKLIFDDCIRCPSPVSDYILQKFRLLGFGFHSLDELVNNL